MDLYAEWVRFRTVGRLVGVVVALVLLAGPGLLLAFNLHVVCSGGAGESCPPPTLGPDGEAVTDQFYFVHRTLPADGSITARVTSLAGIVTYPQDQPNAIVSRVEPWTKAGLIVKQGTRLGSSYAAVMITGGHGVRMQYDYVHDLPGRAVGVGPDSPQWLRLVRHGKSVAAYQSSDDRLWNLVGNVGPDGLSGPVQIGMFVTSPGDIQIPEAAGGGNMQSHFTQANATFDRIRTQGATGRWKQTAIGGGGHTDWEKYHRAAGVRRSGDTVNITGSGDIAPVAGNLLDGAGLLLIGTVAALVAVIVIAARAAGVRRKAPPREGSSPLAQGIVVGSVGLCVGLVGAGVAVLVGRPALAASDNQLAPLPLATELRAILGTGVLFAAAAILALGLASILRRAAVAAVVVIAATVVPYVIAFATLIPVHAANWLLVVTPAAGFAGQQTLVRYRQVANDYTVVNGYFPIPVWGGIAIACAYAAAALGLAVFLSRRRASAR